MIPLVVTYLNEDNFNKMALPCKSTNEIHSAISDRNDAKREYKMECGTDNDGRGISNGKGRISQ